MKSRKQTVIIYSICFLCVLLLAVLFFFSDKLSLDGKPILTFSSESGFYDEEFLLELSSNKGTIYYTLDSSTPSEYSMKYESPILIKDATQNENVYSMRTDLSTFYESGWPTNHVPDYNVDKCTVVRAVAIDKNGERSDEITKVYFVGFENKEIYSNLNIISIVSDPNNLFGYENGILVKGKTYDDFTSATEPYMSSIPSYSVMGNYSRKGQLWERPAEITFFDTERNVVLSDTYGIRLRGSASRQYAIRSFNIFARDEYDSASFPGEKLFGVSGDFKSVSLLAGGNDIICKIKDCMIDELSSSQNMVYKPYVLFLDGEYWGFYWMTERYDESYFENNYDVYSGDVIMVKNDLVELGYQQDITEYNELLSFLSESDMSIEENYSRACELVDIQSCIDYYALEIYVCNIDWPMHNYILWKSREVRPGEYSDGKWRWIACDLNFTASNSNVELDMIGWAKYGDAVFRNLMKNENFAAALTSRLIELSETDFNSTVANTYIDDYLFFYGPILQADNLRFYGGDLEQTIEDSFCNLRCFFEGREVYIPTMCEEQET